jgi:predicted enzyme related to lactoylglutathione lyase
MLTEWVRGVLIATHPRRTAMANPFVHIELQTSDLKKAKDFYGKLFDWKLEDTPMPEIGTYTMIGVGDGTGGGMMTNPMKGAPSMWIPYVDVSDIESSTKKAKALGANILLDVTPVADMGRMSVFADPTGAAIGLWQANPRK